MHCSDLISTAAPGAPDELTSAATRVLAAVADHLATVRPEADLERMELSMCVGAESYFLDGRRIGGDAARIAELAAAMLPAAADGISRGAYVAVLREACAEWDDNERVIPRFPRPRKPQAVAEVTV